MQTTILGGRVVFTHTCRVPKRDALAVKLLDAIEQSETYAELTPMMKTRIVPLFPFVFACTDDILVAPDEGDMAAALARFWGIAQQHRAHNSLLEPDSAMRIWDAYQECISNEFFLEVWVPIYQRGQSMFIADAKALPERWLTPQQLADDDLKKKGLSGAPTGASGQEA